MKEFLVDPVADAILPSVLAFVEEELSERDIPLKVLHQILIAVEEIFTNIAHYAYPLAKGDARIRCTVEDHPPQVVLQFLDRGIPFNPLEHEPPDTTLPPDQRQMGKLGLLMVRKIMSGVAYEYKDGKNILTLKKEL
ncbi:MAG: ATP-binding protein [Desulfobulbus sp.]|jgi:anti-sigma regulatory factor (Ser/Thr protein kinase)|uniref:ATP-binding protein n=1 Tax=Desulfobulbus sp. TaxID=895 RepID=UPI00283BB251|nr:ATP-binding protein [Desulfobulbus sp.]MDR2550508.1 ATP-binding protein [Desulfobulbus sp.]